MDMTDRMGHVSSSVSARRVVFLDVDGTILEHGSVIAPSTVTAIRSARAAGHRVYLCTGRADADIHPDVRAIGVDGAISNGGAFATDGDELILARPMLRSDAARLVDYFERHGLHYFLQSHEAVYASDGIRAFAADFFAQRRAQQAADRRRLGISAPPPVTPISHYLPTAAADLDLVAKAVFVSTEAGSLTHAQRDLGDRFLVIPGSIPLPGGSNGEISVQGTDKGTGVRAMLTHLGLDPVDAVGIGDSWNDREMFEVVGTSVAMGQAPPGVRALADLVTTDVLDDGIWNAFRRLGLIAPPAP